MISSLLPQTELALHEAVVLSGLNPLRTCRHADTSHARPPVVTFAYFAASNQRQLVIGGVHADVVHVDVFWTTGETQSFDALAAATQYLLVQGRPNALALPQLQNQ